MFLMLYDIEGKKDPHGIRIRLVRRLRRNGAFQLQKSAWLIESMDEELFRVTEEFRRAGGSVKIVEWLPRTVLETAGRAGAMSVAVVVLGGEPIVEGWHDRMTVTLQRLGMRVTVRPAGESAAYELAKRMKGAWRPPVQTNHSISRALDEASLMDVDGIVLLNSGRSTQSGIIFGAQAVANTKFMKNMTSLPLIQVERPGKDDGVVVAWNEPGKRLGDKVAREMGTTIITPGLESLMVTREGEREVRQIHYAHAGDLIIVNGIKAGVCLTDQVYLIGENGQLVDIIGGRLDKRAARKVKFDSISKAVVKTISGR